MAYIRQYKRMTNICNRAKKFVNHEVITHNAGRAEFLDSDRPFYNVTKKKSLVLQGGIRNIIFLLDKIPFSG